MVSLASPPPTRRIFPRHVGARYFYESVAHYGVLDGLQYENAHDSSLAYVLFERAGPLQVRLDVALSDPRLEGELAAIANELGLTFS